MELLLSSLGLPSPNPILMAMHLRQIIGSSYPPFLSSSLLLIRQVDVDQLSRRSKDTPWRWDEVEEWLDAAGTTGPRAMCVLAGAGTGKSTISAAIWAQVGGEGGEGGGFGLLY